MSGGCEQLVGNAPGSVAAALKAVDCIASDTTAVAFGRLFAPGGALVTALTISLTLYVAFFAISLLLGRTSLGIRSLTPRMMMLGLVLTFVTSWVAYSQIVWNLAIGGPDELASIITGSQGSATQLFAQKIDVVFAAIQQAGRGTDANVSAFSPEGMIWLGAMLFLLGTVGVLVTARIVLGVLVAIGPVFVVMALFSGTRGLFTGWVKGVVMFALTPLFAVLAGSVMLELAVPVLSALVSSPGVIAPQAAIAFFVIGAIHVALMAMALKVAATMISGWRVFGLIQTRSDHDTGFPSSTPFASIAGRNMRSQASQAFDPEAIPRRITAPAFATAPIESNYETRGEARHTTFVMQRAASGSNNNGPPVDSPLRARGIGSRFRTPASRKSELIK